MRTNVKLASGLLALAFAGATLLAPTMAQGDDITLVDLSLGYALDDDFQGTDGGWTTTEIPPPPPRPYPDPVSWEHADIPTEPQRLPPGDVWQHGVPTYGGDGADGNVWGTVLDGDYGINDCAGLISPVIDLTNAASASIAFDHWHDLRFSGSFAYGSGIVYATTDGGVTLDRLQPANGYDRNLITAARECHDGAPSGTQGYTGETGGWTSDSVDLSAYLGKEVQILFGFAAGGSVNIRPGWYLDNVAVTIDNNTSIEGFESGDGGFAPAPLHPPSGSLPPGGAKSGSKAWATYPAGALSQIECSGIMSPPIDLSGASAANFSFQHWHELRELTTSAPQAALVWATTDGGDSLELLVPAGGYTSQPVTSSATLRCLDSSSSGLLAISGTAADWGEIQFDLSDYLGEENLQIVMGFRKDGVGEYSGWYIDDFTTNVDADGTTTTIEDFESGDGGFTIVGIEPPPHPRGWEWGEPTSGPGTDPGEELWATQLHRDYGHFECSWIESPAFAVGPVPDGVAGLVKARLSFEHWIRTNSIYASAVVQVGHAGEYHVLEPEGGYPTTIGSTSSTFVDVTKWQTDCFGLEWEAGDPLQRGYGGTTTSGGAHAIGAPLTEQFADLTPWVGEEITLRFIFASGWRDANPTTQPGWYVDDVAVEVRLLASVPSPESLVDGLLSNAPGWSSGGPNSEWEWGLAESDMQYATNLLGEYSQQHCGYIESPAVAGSVIAADPTLTIGHRYGMAQSGSFAWYGAYVLASADGGPWTLVSFPDMGFTGSTASRSCVNAATGTQPPTGTPAFGGWQLDWHESTTDLSAFAGADEVAFRFVMGSTSTSTTGCGAETPCNGWSIRSVNVGGNELLAVPDVLVPTLPLP